MTTRHVPVDAADVASVIAESAAGGPRLTICGGGTKAAIGRETPEAAVLDLSRLTGVVDYDPSELVLTVRAGTPLVHVQDLLNAEGQVLAFDPFDHTDLLGAAPASATIGGIVAAGVAGPLRLSCGGTRDHLLGFEAVSGRGEIFVAGGRVVKNVTGYDLSKLVTGSWGRLVALTQVSLKVLPRPRLSVTLTLAGLPPDAAIAAMARAMGSQAEIAAAAHLPGSDPTTAFRINGFPASVDERCAMIAALFADVGPLDRLDEAAARTWWLRIAHATPLPAEPPLWRIVAQPRRVAAMLDALPGAWLLDWAGGLVSLASDAAPETIRAAAKDAGGHAMLVRAPAEMRVAVPAFHPQPDGIARLEERVRRAFDPAGVFETGRF